MGKVGFGELTLWMVTQRRPTPSEVRVFESVLVALADHGFTPTAIAARLTYLSRARLAAGRDRRGAARRRLAVPRGDRGLRPVPGRRARRGGRDPGRRRRVRRARPGGGQAGAGGEEVRPRPRPPGAQGPRPAHPGADRDRRRKRGCAVRTCACSRRSAGSTRRSSAGRCRSTAPASAARCSPTSACRSPCCAGSRCSPGPRACSASSPRSSACRSRTTSTCTWTATPRT